MAYTYDDFLKEYQNSGFMGQMGYEYSELAKTNPQFGKAILDSMRLERTGNLTADQQEHERQYRNRLYLMATNGAGSGNPGSGSGTGNPGSGSDGAGSTGGFVYDRQGEYDAALDAYLNPKPFTYDPAKDPAMAQYRKQYLREAQRAQQDALGQLATATGGIPSSYALTASQQAGDYYRSQLMDRVPEMQNQAYSRFLQGITQKGNALQALSTDRSNAYKQWLTERDYADGQKVEEQKALAEQAEAKAKLGDFSLYQQLYGLTDEEVAGLQETYNADKKRESAELLAETTGDYTELGRLLGWTDAQIWAANGVDYDKIKPVQSKTVDQIIYETQWTPQSVKDGLCTDEEMYAALDYVMEKYDLSLGEYKYLAEFYGLKGW